MINSIFGGDNIGQLGGQAHTLDYHRMLARQYNQAHMGALGSLRGLINNGGHSNVSDEKKDQTDEKLLLLIEE